MSAFLRRRLSPRCVAASTPWHSPIRSSLRIPCRRKTSSHAQARDASIRTKFDRLNSRLPRALQRYTSGLLNAPFSHVASFLVLHELTAVVPLFGFAGLFYYTEWLPASVSEWKWATQGMKKFGSYAQRKGWLKPGESEEVDHVEETAEKQKAWGWETGGNRVLIAFAVSWALTKALLPLRLALSVWATPAFARTTLIPMTRIFARSPKAVATTVRGTSGRSLAEKSSPVAGTNAVRGDVFPRRPKR